MTRDKSDPFKDRREEVMARDCTNPLNEAVREVEIFLLRYGAASHSPLVEVKNLMPGGGILVCRDAEGRKLKIEVTQLDDL